MKPLTIYDYNEIQPYLEAANYEGYNSNFVTMMMWNHEYHIEYEIQNNFLVTLHRYQNEQFWSMPFTTKDNYKEAIDFMIKYSHQHGFTFKMDCATQEFVNDLKEISDFSFLYERTVDNDDYIYDKYMHMTLSGKKMQKRRNHFNSFLKNYPHYEYRDLNFINDFNEVLKCISRWGNEKNELTDSIISEVYGIMYLFSWKELLNVKAGGIYIDGNLEAFIIGSPLNHDTIQIIIEKANRNIRGLYPAILKEFLNHDFKDYKYINREEDMGLESLRKSKRALHPIKMIEKYNIYENNCQIVQADINDESKIKHLWIDIFKDETEKSSEFYFKNCYKNENTYLVKSKNTIIAGMQIVPFSMMINNHIEEVYFILGVFTKKEYEGQGLMKKLVKHVLSLDKYKDKKIYLQAYKPEIYKSLGFKTSHLHMIYIPDINLYQSNEIDTIVEAEYRILYNLYNRYTKNFTEYRIRDEYYFEWLIDRCNAFDQKIKIFKYNDEIEGYVIYSSNQDELYVSELIYTNEDSLNRIIHTLFTVQSKLRIETDLKTKIAGESEYIITMLSNNSDDNYLDKYINEVY